MTEPMTEFNEVVNIDPKPSSMTHRERNPVRRTKKGQGDKMKTIRARLAGLGLMMTLGGMLGGCVGTEPDAIATVTCGTRVYNGTEWIVEWREPMRVEVYGENYRDLEGWARFGDHRVCDVDLEWVRTSTATE